MIVCHCNSGGEELFCAGYKVINYLIMNIKGSEMVDAAANSAGLSLSVTNMKLPVQPVNLLHSISYVQFRRIAGLMGQF